MKKTFLSFGLLLVTVITMGQKMDIIEGDISNLKGIFLFEIEFEFNKEIQIPNYDSEEAYLKEMMAKKDEKSKGTGEIFKKNWFDDREEKYLSKFMEGFNQQFKNEEVKVVESGETAYILSITTTKLFPGTNIGVSKNTSNIDVKILVYERAFPSLVLLEGTYSDIIGYGKMGFTYDNGYRLSECYKEVGKLFANYIRKKAK